MLNTVVHNTSNHGVVIKFGYDLSLFHKTLFVVLLLLLFSAQVRFRISYAQRKSHDLYAFYSKAFYRTTYYSRQFDLHYALRRVLFV